MHFLHISLIASEKPSRFIFSIPDLLIKLLDFRINNINMNLLKFSRIELYKEAITIDF